MNNYIGSSDDNFDIENIDLANTYTENNLKDIKSDISNLRSRAATFLGFAGVLLRFIIELSNSQPSYLYTKIGAFLACFYSIFVLALSLISNPRRGEITYEDFINKYLLPHPILDVKRMILKYNIEFWEYLYSQAHKIKDLLNQAIIGLVLSAFFFGLNNILVSFIEK
ncbi:hypothetical protein QUA43_28775 [Microcoleus sp. N9_B4]|uniref:hypothetical protein n=1 Tax=Microcoleus sp. N9_B4 TaxID=3055386 RepID=UPI002FD00362